MMKSVLVPVSLLVLLAVAGCATPTHVGTGTLDTLLVPLDFQPGALFATPDENYILCETQRDKNLLFSGNLEILRTQALDFRAFGFASDSLTAAAITGTETVLVTVPDLRRLQSFPKPAGSFSGLGEIFGLPANSGFVAVSNDVGTPNVWMISGTPARFAASGRTSDPQNLRGAAVDQATSQLVVTGDRNLLEIFDTSRMETAELLELPCRETDYGLVTGLGWAFVSTRDGIVIPVDLAARAHAAPLRIAGRGHMDVALSRSGRLLAVCHQDRSARKAPYPTTLKVFSVDQGNAVELGTAFFQAPGTAEGIVVIEGTRRVVLSCAPKLFVWSFE